MTAAVDPTAGVVRVDLRVVVVVDPGDVVGSVVDAAGVVGACRRYGGFIIPKRKVQPFSLLLFGATLTISLVERHANSHTVSICLNEVTIPDPAAPGGTVDVPAGCPANAGTTGNTATTVSTTTAISATTATTTAPPRGAPSSVDAVALTKGYTNGGLSVVAGTLTLQTDPSASYWATVAIRNDNATEADEWFDLYFYKSGRYVCRLSTGEDVVLKAGATETVYLIFESYGNYNFPVYPKDLATATYTFFPHS